MSVVKKGGTRSLTIVLKLGTSSIVHEHTHQPLIGLLSSVVETVVQLRSHGHRVVLVSSGAIGVGLKRMDLPERPKHLSGKQALAAIGQGRLIALWDNLFGQLGQPIAQILLTRGDISDRSRYLNAVNTLTELLSMGVVPIINENDTVSVSEIRFGDNDTLSAITSSMLHADYLFLLTDVDCLYTSNPRKDPLARPIEEVTSVSAIRSQVSTATLGSKLGTGGMETKLIAAEIATAAGVSVIINSSKRPETILDIIQYNMQSLPPSMDPTLYTSPTPTPSTPLTEMAAPSFPNLPSTIFRSSILKPSPATGTSTPVRPLHTLFKPAPTPLADLKSWTAHTLTPAGSVIVDSGAHNVLSRRESGGRLLAVGVLGVIGTFAAGQAVRIVIRRSRRQSSTIAVATSTLKIFTGSQGDLYASEKASIVSDVGLVESMSPDQEEAALTPDTPNLDPVRSNSSSMSSLDPLSRIGSLPSLLEGRVASLAAIQEHSMSLGQTAKFFTPDDALSNEESENWETVEVGRGLANYNSAELQKIRGSKSSHIRQLIGYADSEYVVENITIRLSPIDIL